MIQKNRYFRRSKISEAKFRQLVRYFAMDLTATDCAQLCGLSLRSVNSIYLRMRARMAEHCEARSPFVGELEADDSYFGPRRVRGLRGRGAGRKTGVFGLFKQRRLCLHRDRARCLQTHLAGHHPGQGRHCQHHSH